MKISDHLPESFEKIVPQLAPWVEHLPHTKIAMTFQSLFAFIEIFHILGLFMLGGATLLTCLRLMNVGMTDVPTAQVEKNTRLWFTIGVIMAVGTGLAIGTSNASKLYNNTAFLLKMISLLAGIIFSYMVVMPTAQKDGKVGPIAKIGLVIGLALQAFSMLLFAVMPGANPGFFHLLWFAALISFFVVQGKARWLFGVGIVVIMGVWQTWTHLIKPLPVPGTVSLEEMTTWYAIDHTFLVVATLWIFGMAALNIWGVAAKADSTRMTRLVGYAGILIWITVGAGGRWIGLS